MAQTSNTEPNNIGPNNANPQDFITKDQWDSYEKYDGTDQILKWIEVPQNIIFCIDMIEDKKDLKFQSHIIHFCDKDNNTYRVFAPSHFIKEIRRRRAINARPYFCSYGLIEYANRKIAKFEISFKEENKNWSIFQ